MPDIDARIRSVRDQLEGLVRVPDHGEVGPLTMARYLAVSAAWRLAAVMERPEEQAGRIARIEAMAAEFTAATAMFALAGIGRGPELDLGVSPEIPKILRDMKPGDVATFIRDSWDGDSLGEVLHEYLGRDLSARVRTLVGQLFELTSEAKAARPATATVRCDDLRVVLGRSAVIDPEIRDRLTEAAGMAAPAEAAAAEAESAETTTECWCGTDRECAIHSDPAVLEAVPAEAVSE